MSIIGGRNPAHRPELDEFEPTAARAPKYEEHVRARYGLQPAEYRAMFRDQKGRCAICREDADLQVDHDHTDGHVRGLLCRSCNARVEHPQGDSDLAARIVAYLQERAPKVRITRL